MANANILEAKILHQEKSTLTKVTFDLQQFNGTWQQQERVIFEHGNAVTALLYNTTNSTVILTRQFRLPTFLNGNESGELLEACAGILEKGELPKDAVIREIQEETGYEVNKVDEICEAYSSPGAYKELVHYFLVPVTTQMKKGNGGGLKEEGEDVKIVEITFADAWQMVMDGKIKDAKTLLLLCYAKANGLL